MILLDNANSHLAKNTIDFMKSNFEVIFFLPQYSHHYTPVESSFSIMKSNLCSSVKEIHLNWHNNSSINSIEKTIKRIGRDQIIHIWDHNYKIIKEKNRDFIQMSKEC